MYRYARERENREVDTADADTESRSPSSLLRRRLHANIDLIVRLS